MVNLLRTSFTNSSLYVARQFSSSLGYVKQIKLLQELKEKKGINDQWISNANFLLFQKSKPLITSRSLAWIQRAELSVQDSSVRENAVLVGICDEGQMQLAVPDSILDGESVKSLETKHRANFADLRFAMLMLPATEVQKLSKATSLLNWHRRTNFCSNCGNKTSRNTAGTQRACGSCGTVHYPNLNPVGIVLVTNADQSKVLLVRQPRHPKGMYTCIAGFVDAGETVEDSIRREVAEEVGLFVNQVEYGASQHWPFPTSNLMIACRAVVEDDSCPLDVDTGELEGARWFSREEVTRAVQSIASNPMQRLMSSSSDLFVPPHGTVANTLITNWLK